MFSNLIFSAHGTPKSIAVIPTDPFGKTPLENNEHMNSHEQKDIYMQTLENRETKQGNMMEKTRFETLIKAMFGCE